MQRQDEANRCTSESFGVESVVSHDATTVWLWGELDLLHRADLEQLLDQLSTERDRIVVLDLSRLDFIEAHAVVRCHEVGEQLRARGSRLVLRHPRPVVERILSVIDLDGA